MTEAQEARLGSNSNLTSTEAAKLKIIIAEIEDIDSRGREVNAERGATYKRAKSEGFDTKALKELVKLRRIDPAHRDAYLNSLEAYQEALGMLADTPLGQAAMERAGVAPAAPPA